MHDNDSNQNTLNSYCIGNNVCVTESAGGGSTERRRERETDTTAGQDSKNGAGLTARTN